MLEVYKRNSKLTKFSFGAHSITTDDCDTEVLYTTFKESHFQGCYKESVYENFKIAHGRLNFKNATQFHCTYLDSSIEMLFLLRGSLYTSKGNPTERRSFKFNTHNLIHRPSCNTIIEFDQGETQFISIQLTPALFKNFMPLEKEFEAFNLLFQEQQAGYLMPTDLQISFPMEFILDEIIASTFTGHYRKIFLHAKVLELFLLQLNQCRNDADTSSISNDDKLKIQQAKQYIVNNYNQSITISMIAKHIGTNEFTLKKGFKELVGTTVFGYINDIKMDKAKKLLADKNTPITQVSEMIGYKNPQHFSTAFKKKFGVVPSKFKASLGNV